MTYQSEELTNVRRHHWCATCHGITSDPASPCYEGSPADEREAAEEQLRYEYARAVQAGDLKALALFAPRKIRRLGCDGQVTCTVAEVIAESLDYRDLMDRAMAILVNAAAGRATQREAQQLLNEAGAHWADAEADFV